MRIAPWIFMVLSFSVLVSCGGSDDGGKVEQQQQEEDITFDSELSDAERRALEESKDAISALSLDGSQARGFSQVFGGNSSANVAEYLDARVQHYISEDTDFTSRLAFISPAALRAQEVFASNPSLFIWYYSKIAEPEDLRFETNGNLVEIDSTRIGVMQVGSIFVDSDTITQAITLVHEARHSDCPGGALASDIQRFEEGFLPVNRLCGHLHEECPPGHPLEGIPACESNTWGAYAIDYIYSIAIVETCSSCSETERQSAEINAFDVKGRTIYDMEALLNGELGPPDMSSSNQVR